MSYGLQVVLYVIGSAAMGGCLRFLLNRGRQHQ